MITTNIQAQLTSVPWAIEDARRNWEENSKL